MYYILVDKKVVTVDNVAGWAAGMEDSRRVKSTRFFGLYISTVFLGIDHRLFGSSGPPLLFETMIFGRSFYSNNEYQARYSTWDEAIKGHTVAVWIAIKSLFTINH